MCLESLIPMAEYLSKEENQIHTLDTLLAAGEDKSWKVRLAFARNFSKFAMAFGKEITDNNLIQTFTILAAFSIDFCYQIILKAGIPVEVTRVLASRVSLLDEWICHISYVRGVAVCGVRQR